MTLSATGDQFTQIHQTIKMKTTLVLFIVACAMAAVYGDLICGSSFCKKNPCVVPISQNSCLSPSVYSPAHAGLCGCCPACVTLLGEGAACKTYDKEIGATPVSVCREPLRCLKGVCTKILPRN